MTAYNVIKSMTKRGNSVIGSGCYAAALTSTTDQDKIIKIGNNIYDPWLDYYTLVMDNQKNPCVPRIYSLYKDDEHSYYVCIMEKLSGVYTEQDTTAMDICKDYAEGWTSSEEFLKAAAKYIKQIPYPDHMLNLLDKIKEKTDYTKNNYPEDDDAEGRMLDLHHNNFLLRDGAIIVTDPWCDTCMDDIDDVNAWASKHNID